MPGCAQAATTNLTGGMQLSAIGKIDCLRKRPNLMAGQAPFASLRRSLPDASH
jgi:hypothetical protein